MINNFSTINQPKHFVTAGRPVGKRITKYLWDAITSQISNRLRNGLRMGTHTFAFVQQFTNHDNYGDIDLVLSKSHLPTDWENKFKTNVFGSKFSFKVPNTSTTVFDYEGHQVNVHVYEGHLGHALMYLNKQGAGTLFEILADHLGMVFNLDGLYLKTGIEEQPLLEIVTDAQYQYRLLGVSSEHMQYYSHTEKDVFSNLAASGYFHRAPFMAYEGNTEYLAKNPIVGRFIAYLKTRRSSNTETAYDINSENAKKQMILNFQHYAPTIRNAYTALMKKHRMNLLIKGKFNAEKVAEVTEVHEEHLKAFMDSFATSLKGYEKFRMFILTSLPDTIATALLKHRNETLKPEQYGPKPEVAASPVAKVLPEAPVLEAKPKAKKKAAAKTAKAVAKKAEVAAKVEVKKRAPKKSKVATAIETTAAEPLPRTRLMPGIFDDLPADSYF